jgi:GGDEF domain-containing protein
MLIHIVAETLLLLAVATGALATIRAAIAWHQRRRRFGLLLLGLAVLLAAAVGPAARLAQGAPPPANALGWIALVPSLALPLVMLMLLRAIRRQDEARRRASLVRRVSPVTGFVNRLHLLPLLMPAIAQCRRDDRPVTFIALAPDGLEEAAALRGPDAPEALIRSVADTLRDVTRASDLVGHLAPEVLLACLPGTGPLAARAVAERLAARVAEEVPHPAMDGRRATISLGLAVLGDGAAPAAIEEASAAALGALAAARAAGGGTIEVAPPPPPRRPRPAATTADAVPALR